LIGRVIALTQAELAAGKSAPAGEFAWLLFGAAGRRALLALAELECGLVYDDAAPGAEAAAQTYYAELSRAAAVHLGECGFRVGDETSPLGNAKRCRPLSAWKQSYSGWVENPILNRIYEARSYFDFLAAAGSRRFADELASHILEEVRANESFLPLLANDSMANLPPLTFFRGFVVDESNIQKDSLDIGRSVLSPLIDVGRVFALGASVFAGASTLDRFASAASAYPAYAQTFAGAADALRVGLYQQAVFGLKEGGSGTIIRPPELSKYDQQLLKSAFRSILSLIETAAKHHGIRPR
jgi:CBS domain-containing protein